MNSQERGRLGIPEMPVSKSYEHYTPRALFDYLDETYHFTLDPCAATYGPPLCPNNYYPWDDGLSKEWTGSVFMNPPYGRQLPEWVKKASESAWSTAECVVGLLPARTDTKWFHEYVLGNQIRFIRGRISFGSPGTGQKPQPAPFPSMFVVWGSLAEPYSVFGVKLPRK